MFGKNCLLQQEEVTEALGAYSGFVSHSPLIEIPLTGFSFGARMIDDDRPRSEAVFRT